MKANYLNSRLFDISKDSNLKSDIANQGIVQVFLGCESVRYDVGDHPQANEQLDHSTIDFGEAAAEPLLDLAGEVHVTTEQQEMGEEG